MEFKNLIFEKEDGLAILTLNRPKAFNAFNEELIDEINEALTLLEQDQGLRVLILTGGSRAFAAGGDVSAMATADTIDIYRYAAKINRVYDRLEALPCPTIAAINGLCLGGGCEIAMCCDFRIAGEGAIFGQPEILLGILPGAGGTQRLPRLVGPSVAKEMIYIGDNVKAAKALEMALVNKVVSDAQVMDEAKAMAAKLMDRPGMALRFAKEAINTGINFDMNTGKKVEIDRFAMVFSTNDQKEGMRAFIEKQKPVYIHQ